MLQWLKSRSRWFLCVTLSATACFLLIWVGNNRGDIAHLSRNLTYSKMPGSFIVPPRMRYRGQEKERKFSQERLSQMSDIKRMNSDPLPPRKLKVSAEEMCADPANECVPPLLNLETRLRVAEKYKLVSCIIQKSMSTVMTAIVCFLNDEAKFRAAKREFTKECHNVRFCMGKNEYSAMWKVRRVYNITVEEQKNWKFTLITRDPIDRFLSGFVDKCIRKPKAPGFCNGCGRNMTCFLITEYKRILKQVKIEKFYRSFEDRHFFPQNWRCGLDKELNNYRFLRYSSDPMKTLIPDLFEVLKEQQVPQESFDFINDQMTRGRTVHSTFESEPRKYLEERLRSSPFLMDLLVRIFYHDFKILRYEIPPF